MTKALTSMDFIAALGPRAIFSSFRRQSSFDFDSSYFRVKPSLLPSSTVSIAMAAAAAVAAGAAATLATTHRTTTKMSDGASANPFDF